MLRKSELPLSCRKMLDYLIATPPDVSDRYFTAEYLPANSHIGYPDGEDAVDYLLERGFLSAPSEGLVKLTLTGRQYKDLIRIESIERWKERILGFITGIGATVIVCLIEKAIS